MEKTLAPVRLTIESLMSVGVDLIEHHNIKLLECMTCGRTWSPYAKTANDRTRAWWECPTDPDHTKRGLQ